MKANWQQMMKRKKMDSIKAKSPGFFAASGGYSMSVKPYTDKTANGLTKSIIDFLTFNGHYANRISTQGQARVHEIKRYDIFSKKMQTIGQNVKWTKGSTRTGTPDVDAIINGRPAKIEFKVGKDTMSDEQKRERSKIEQAGGLYFIAHNMPSFLNWYETIIK